jgi:hypothetical protein
VKARPDQRATSRLAAAVERSRAFLAARRIGDASKRRTARVRRAARLTRELFTFLGMG